MLHLNDNLYTKLTCLFVGSKFLVSHRRLRTPKHFYELLSLELCLTTTNGSFTRGCVYPCLLLPNTIFLYHIIQPCDSVGLHPTRPSPPNQAPNTMLIFQPCTHTHSMGCSRAYAMQCAIACYIMSHATQIIIVSWTIILIAYNFQLNSYHANIFMHTCINMLSHNYQEACLFKIK